MSDSKRRKPIHDSRRIARLNVLLDIIKIFWCAYTSSLSRLGILVASGDFIELMLESKFKYSLETGSALNISQLEKPILPKVRVVKANGECRSIATCLS